MVKITALYVALHAVLLLALAVQVMLQRGKQHVGLGDGGNEALSRAIRVHGNAVEYVPIALLLMLVYEINAGAVGSAALWLHGCGSLLLISRLAHAWGLSRNSGESFGRAAGVVGTFVATGILIVLNLVKIA
ncbi:MAG: MAPEG family protein [Herbaspirillum sp.]